MCVYINYSAGQIINCAESYPQKSVNIIYVCAVYIYYACINTHTGMYIIKKNKLCLYIKYIYI